MHLLCTIPGHGEPLEAWGGLFSQPYPPQVKKKKKKKNVSKFVGETERVSQGWTGEKM